MPRPDIQATMGLDISDFEKALNNVLPRALAKLNQNAQQTATAANNMNAAFMGAHGGLQRLTKAGIELGESAILVKLAGDMLTLGRNASDITRSLDALDTSGYITNLTKAQQATDSWKKTALDVVGPTLNLIEKIPILGSIITGPARNAQALNALRQQAFIETRRNPANAEGALQQLNRLTDLRAELFNQGQGITGRALRLFTFGASERGRDKSLKEVDERRNFLAKEYGDMLKQQTTSQNVILAGGIKRQQYAQIELTQQQKILALSEEVKNKYGLTTPAGQKVFEEGTKQYAREAKAQKEQADYQYQTNLADYELQKKVAETKLNGATGARDAARAEYDTALKLEQLSKGKGEEEEKRASAASQVAAYNLDVSQRDLDNAKIEADLQTRTANAQKTFNAVELETAKAQLAAAQARAQLKLGPTEAAQAAAAVTSAQAAVIAATVERAGAPELVKAQAKIALEKRNDLQKQGESLGAESAKLQAEQQAATQQGVPLDSDLQRDLTLRINQNARARELNEADQKNLEQQKQVEIVASKIEIGAQGQLKLLQAQAKAQTQIVENVKAIYGGNSENVKAEDAKLQSLKNQSLELTNQLGIQEQSAVGSAAVSGATLRGANRSAQMLTTRTEYQQRIEEAEASGASPATIAAIQQEGQNVLQGQAVDREFQSPAERLAEHRAQRRRESHLRALAKRGGNVGFGSALSRMSGAYDYQSSIRRGQDEIGQSQPLKLQNLTVNQIVTGGIASK